MQYGERLISKEIAVKNFFLIKFILEM